MLFFIIESTKSKRHESDTVNQGRDKLQNSKQNYFKALYDISCPISIFVDFIFNIV